MQLWQFWDFFKLKKIKFGDIFFQNNKELAFIFPKYFSQNRENSPPKTLIH